MSQTLSHEYLGVSMFERSRKPRSRGLTMVIDSGESWQFEEGILDAWGAYIDVVKLTIRHLLQPVDVLRKKIDTLKKYEIEVQPGGIIVEVARFQHQGEDFLRKLRDLGFTQIEISASTTERRAMEEEEAFTRLAKKLGFKVFGEIGKKMFEGDATRVDAETLNVKENINQIRRLLDAGADRVYVEGHVLRRVMGDSASDILKKQSTGTKQMLEIVNAVGLDKLVFECSGMVPRKTRRAMHFWYIYLFGPDVNIGNARIEEISTIESVRRGIYPVFGFGPAGDHPWITSLAAHDGVASEGWWKEFPLKDEIDPLSQ
ncbi:MAG: phosphosulfolactate synthase [Deltaproteobacteria bacterium]|nr:phosphosulfolactate synthase [Deltaproteobacteria bacterium]